ncbi:unnamed protein product [Alopecurus aequalis]
MALPLKQLIPCLCSFLLLFLLPTMSISHAKAEPCKCPDSYQYRRINYTMEDTRAIFYLINKEYGTIFTARLSFLRNLSKSDQKNIRALSTTHQGIRLWQTLPDGLEVEEASFSVTFVYKPLPNQRQSGIAFIIVPSWAQQLIYKGHMANDTFMPPDDGSLHLQGTPRNSTINGSSVSVTIGALESMKPRTLIDDPGMAIDINIDAAAAFTYAVWIEYDRVGHRLSAYVDREGKPKPASAIAEAPFNLSAAQSTLFRRYYHSSDYEFGLLSTVAQQLTVSSWNATVEHLPSYDPYDGDGGFLSRKVTILSSVLGSVAATAMMATALACYFNSRYRRWHKDLDQLARTMECLPGVPTKVEFAEIKKATGNFHETMKLGGGGFGTVYRCTLPATASKTERPMDVAVKRFTRDVQNRRYDDFLAEVSVINRLRHKNIVPLVGWSYNKGEPLLVFEFMTNSSLDQHLFPKLGERQSGAAIRQWATRYGIIRDIATGLHYVHHEYEPMVLHRDIKASNVMLDSSFSARLGDFGLACTVAMDRNSVTGVAGTWGYIAPEYAVCGKATRQTDVYALGVLILEIVTGKRALDHQAVDDDDVHITDRVWRIHREGRLVECIDATLINTSSLGEEEQLDTAGDAKRLLLLGLACSNPNPSERPTMPEVVQVLTKSAQPPTVPLVKPRFVWPPPEWMVSGTDDSVGTSVTSVNDLDRSTTRMRQPTVVSERRAVGGHASLQLEQSVYVTATSDLV